MDNSKMKKAVVAAVFGNILEWYDFVLYAFFALYISRNFFVDSSESMSLIKTFIVFGAAYVARPLGALVIGNYADTFGRKNALSLTIIIMALGTAIIAFTPSVHTIGIYAPILLLVGRLLQGFSAGGEIGSATAFLLEYAPQDKKTFYTSLFQSCMGIAAVLGSLVGIVITWLYSEQEILAWAWRIPFILGLAIFPVGFYIRKTIDETPEFSAYLAKKQNKTPLKEIFTLHKKPLFLGICFGLFWTVCPYVFVMFMPSFFIHSGFDKNDVFIASMVANLFMAIISPMSGSLADKYGMKKVILTSIAIMVVGNFAFMHVALGEKTLFNATLSHSGFLILISFFIGVAPAFVSRAFPVSVRAVGVNISYNVAAVLTGFTPAFLAFGMQYFSYLPALYVLIFAIFAFFATIKTKENQ